MAGLFDDLKGNSASQSSDDGLFDDLKPKAEGIGDTLAEGAKSTGRALSSAVRSYTGNGQGIADGALEQQQAPRDQRLEKFQQDYADRTGGLGDDPGVLDTIGEGIGAVVDNPAGAGLAVLEQLPNAAVSLGAGWAGMKAGGAAGAGIGSVVPGVGTAAGGVAGGILGGLAGMFLGNAALETGNKAMSLADDGEVTPEEMAQARSEGAIKGGVITGIDALTLGVGGKVASTLQRTSATAIEAATRKVLVDRGIDVADEAAVIAARSNPEIAGAVRAAQENARKATDKLGKRIAVGGTVLGLETIGEGAGEYLGELAATGQGNVPDAVLEGLLSLGQSGAETAWNMARTSPANLVQPQPSAENPAPAPVPRPDPNAGAISRTAAMLPAPDRLALPAPEQVLYADSAGQVSEQGPSRDVDREQRPVPGREQRVPATGGPGMDQQTPRGVLSIAGDLLLAERGPQLVRALQQPSTYEGELVRPGIPDLRPEAVIVDEQGQAQLGRVPTQQPANTPERADGMTTQAVAGQRPRFEQVLERARQGGVDAAALATETGATRAQAARALRGAETERATTGAIYKSVPGANKALRELPQPGAFEVVKAGRREWRIQRRQEVQGVDGGQGAADVGAASNLPAASATADLVAGSAAVVERAAATRTQAEPSRAGVPAANEGANGQRALTTASKSVSTGPRRKVNRDRDSLLQAAIRLGGIKTEWRQDTTGEAKGNRNLPGIGSLWSDKTGTSLDDMASLLDQHGYIPAGEMNNLGGVPWLQQALRDELAGSKHFAVESAAQQEQMEREVSQRYADEQARLEQGREAEYARIEAEYGADIADQARAYDEAAKAYDEQVLAEAQQFEDDYEQRQQEFGDIDAALEGKPLDQAGAAARDEQLRQADDRQDRKQRAPAGSGEGQAAEPRAFGLEQQTEQGLREQAAQQQAAEKAEAEAQRLAEQKAQADSERNDFTLTGSDRPSDVGAARGQNDLFAAPTRGEKVAKEAAQQRPTAAVVEDAGEKLGGARKDELRGVRERLDNMDDEAIASSKLSDLWPKGEIDRIEDDFHAAAYQVIRDLIPAKPRVAYKVRGWVNKVKAAREVLADLSRMGDGSTVKRMRAFSPSLRQVADKIELLVGVERQQWGRIGQVRMATGSYSVDGQMTPGTWAEVEIDGRNKYFYGKDSIAEALPDIQRTLNLNSAPEKLMKFDVYTDRRSGEVFIAKNGDRETRRLATFKTVAEARDYIGSNHPDLVAAWDAVKNRDNVTKADVRGENNEERTGRDHRAGEDVSPDQFLQAFGFRGVEFGNWVKQGTGDRDRQGMLNAAYDAFMDLADVIGVQPKALSLGGTLGIGFGSRGSGRASAHFEPDRVVINLTKTKGAGTLAHEWFHALDNYFARRRAEQPGSSIKMNDRQTAYITYRPEPLLVNKKYPSRQMGRAELSRYQANHPNAPLYAEDNWEKDPSHPAGVRPQVERAFAELVETLNASPMLQRAKVIDGATSDGYWSRIIERGARSFETYVIARLADRGYRNDYLANVQTLEAFARDPGRYPYLTPNEQGPVNEAFDKLFSTVQTRVDEGGAVVMYSRSSYRRPAGGQGGARAAQLRLQLKRLTGGWQNAPQITVVQSVKDLPDAQRRRVERDGAFDVEGMFADDQVYLVADNLRDVKHAAFVLQHEVLGHAGLQGAYGQRLTPLLMSLYNGNKDLQRQADVLVQKFGYTPAVAMEEVLADMAAAGTLKDQPFWSRLVTAMRNALRSIGMNLSWSEGDIQSLLANARRYIERGKKGGRGRSVFSRTGDSGRLIEIVDDKGRLLAPNGKPSKLNQKQWHQARSDNFKRWFGDWQALEAQQRLDAMKPLKLRTPDAWKGLSERERLAKVESTLKSMARLSEALPHGDLGEVTMGMSGAKKASSSAADPAKQAILARLQRAFEHSIYASGAIDQNAPTMTVYHKLLAPIDVDGVPLVAVFTVREDANGRMFYNTVAVDRKDEAPAVSPGDMSENAQRSTPANARAPADFVRRPLTRVNPDDVSKVTDGNGEPMVLYHGTAEEFSVFEQGRAGRSTGHATAPLGIFMTSSREVAKAYAEKATDGMPGLANVMPLFASIKKPYRMSMAESQALDTVEVAIAFRQKLESEGYDGIQLDGGVWVAFYNTQMKSATNNTGAFDEIDPDIRYSRAGQRDIEALRKLGLAGSEAQNLLDRMRNLTLGGLQQKLKEWSVRSEEGIFDGLAGIKRAEQAAGVTDPNQQGYVSARLASGIADVMHGVLHYAAPEWRDGVVSGKAGTRGVLEILGDLGQDNLTPWLGWLGGKRAQLLKAQGRENNLSDADIAELLAMGRGKEALFEKVYREYAQVNEAVLDLAQGAGLIDQDARAKWLTDYYVPFYRQDEAEGIFTAPRTKRGLSHQTAAIKALKGGTLPTNDLLANMLAGWTKRIDASMKNKALLEVVDNLKGSDFIADESPRWQQVLISRDQIARQIRKDRKALALAADLLNLPAGSNSLKVVNQLMKPENEGFEKLWTRVAPTDPDIIRVQRDGKNEYYRVNDESLLRGLKFMEGSTFNDPITKIGRTFKRLLTTGVTASPDFILRNFIRDAAHAWMINKDGFTLGKDSIKGMRDALREDQDYRDLMFAGGSFQGGYVHGADPEASAQIIRRALEKKGFTARQQDAYLDSLVNTPAKAAAMLGKGWQKYRELGDKVENANRLSTYKAAREKGKSRRQASFEAKDLMDYSLRGNFAAAQWFTDVVPFLNARLQGLYKLGRAVKGDKSLLAKEVAMKGGYIALFSLLLAGINDDDERYQALQDWDKDMHWHIFLGDEHYRIPKPFELGLLFGTVPERLLHTLTGSQDGGDLAKAVSQGVFQTLAFNPVPQFYQPIRELQANRNFFRDAPIEDMSDEGKLPEARYDERTSAIGKALGQVTGPTIGISPKQIDHLVQGYTGTLGGYVLGMSSLIAAGLTEGDSPAWRAEDLPVAKVMYQGDAPRSSKYQAEFYDMLTEADQLHRTLKSYREEGRLEAAASLLENSRDKLRHRPALGLARRQLGNIRNQMDAIYRDKVMDGAEKRRRLDDLQRRANEVAERVVKRAGADF